jgi:hypothetical protein
MRWASFGVSPSAARHAVPRQSLARFGRASSGQARAADGSAESFGSPRRPLGWIWLDIAGHGWARREAAGFGRAWPGLTISALSPSGLSAGFPGIQIWRNMERRGNAEQSPFWRCKARHGLQMAARSFYGGSLLLS